MDNLEPLLKFTVMYIVIAFIGWIGKHSTKTVQRIEYDLINIQIDDDSEYHIVYSDGNNVYTEGDLDYNIKIKYFNNCKPKLVKYTTNNNPSYDSIQVILPAGYKITIFND